MHFGMYLMERSCDSYGGGSGRGKIFFKEKEILALEFIGIKYQGQGLSAM